MTDRTRERARLGTFAMALVIALSAMGAAAALIAARTPDASDIPQIATARPLVTALSPAEESTAAPTGTVEATIPPAPADRYVPGGSGGDVDADALPDRPDGDEEADGDDDGDDDEREVITPPVREDDDSEDDSDGSEKDEKRESLPETDDSPEED